MPLTTWSNQPKMAKIQFAEVPYKRLCEISDYPNARNGKYAMWGSLENLTATEDNGLLLLTGSLYTKHEQIPPVVTVGHITKGDQKVMVQKCWVPIYDYEEYQKTLGIYDSTQVAPYAFLVERLSRVLSLIKA